MTGAAIAKRRYSSEELKAALATVAEIIVAHGDAYLPIFERLERELDGAVERELTLERVKSAARIAQQTRNKRVTKSRHEPQNSRLSA